jgi:hypothetical protein
VGLLLWLVPLLAGAGSVQAQADGPTGAVGGFVTDAADGQSLTGATVVLRRLPDTTTSYGTATDQDGLYLLDDLPTGRYEVQVSFVGYETHRDTVRLAPGQQRTVSAALSAREATLGEVVVEEARPGTPDRVAGGERIAPEEVERIPTPDVGGDLVSYLTMLPGTVTMADRGGQLFIRGGEPSQNMVLLDGMVLYQPFHLLGFYSAFPSEIIDHTDFYAGGFGAKYGRRLSSVIDVASRAGNKRRLNGSAQVSPFTAGMHLEGPLGTERVSGLVSARRSTIDRAAGPLLGDDLPFVFGDVFGNVHADLTDNSRLSVTALRTHDRGPLGPEPDLSALPEETIQADPFGEVRWQNWGVSARYLAVPAALPVITDLHVSVSGLHTELGPPSAPTRSSSVQTTRLAFDARFPGNRTTIRAGFEGSFSRLSHELGGLYQDTFSDDRTTLDHIVGYLEPEIDLGGGFRLQPGLRLQFLQSRFQPFPVPRLRMSWTGGPHRVSAAGGLYYQEVVGLSDRRDAASVFTAWTNIPKHSGLPRDDVRRGQTPRALHGILGYQVALSPALSLSLEGYYKHLSDLFIAEWTAFPRFTTRLQPADGRSFGGELRLEANWGPLYAQLGYGYSNTLYDARQEELTLWYGVETLRFRPPHDRRHQVSALVAAEIAGVDARVRWQFASGRPYTQIAGFDGFAPVTRVADATDLPGTRRVIYASPFDGVLPPYHRLDVSVERTFALSEAVALTVQATAINAYHRRNIFYLDTFTRERVDQLPFTPSLGIALRYQ